LKVSISKLTGASFLFQPDQLQVGLIIPQASQVPILHKRAMFTDPALIHGFLQSLNSRFLFSQDGIDRGYPVYFSFLQFPKNRFILLAMNY
jgi:hypothetical protein